MLCFFYFLQDYFLLEIMSLPCLMEFSNLCGVITRIPFKLHGVNRGVGEGSVGRGLQQPTPNYN